MKLKSVKVDNLRSINQVELANCGEFNVLIGKNNSGKSNILSAIQAFFTCVQGDNIIVAEPPFGKKIDFFNRSSKQPIDITLSFSLTLAERDALVQDIVNEAPQMRNAIEGIDPSLELIVTATITQEPNQFGFVSKIVLGSNLSSGTREKLILKVGNEAALELNKRFSSSRQLNGQIKVLRSLPHYVDSEIWRRFSQQDVVAGTRTRTSVRNVVRRIPTAMMEDLAESTINRLETLMSDSSSYDEFLRATRAVQNKIEEEVANIQDEPLKNKIDTFAGEEVTVPYYVKHLLERVGQMKVLYLREQRKQIGKEEAARLLTLKTRRGGPQVLSNIQETVSALLGVKIDAFESEASSSIRSTAELDVDDFLVEVNGSGIREALRLILEVEFEHPNILLVEEPEIHLHPALETSMMRYLQRISNDRQVFITTHSTNFIDTAEMGNVYLVSKPHSTRVQLLNFEEAEAEIPRELGIRPSALFMFDELVFVEGMSDAAIIREWATTLGKNFSRSNVGFITMEGSRNLAHFAAPTTISFLQKRQVKLWMLIDHDERDDIEITKLKNSLGQKVNVRVLKKREIENYLICPRTISMFIELKRELGLSEHAKTEAAPSISEVKAAIEECSEKLKQFAIDKRVVRQLCVPIRPIFNWNLNRPEIVGQIISANQKITEQLEADNKRSEEIYKEQVRIINETWQSSKLDLVPGDHLLDMVCRIFGVRYKKELDGSRLATLMNEHEIDEEIKLIIKEIGSEAL